MVSSSGDAIAGACNAIFAACSAPLYAVAKRLSAHTPCSDASARSRAITARKLSSSFLDVLCRLTSLLVSNCVQVTLFTFHELTIPVQHICQKVIARGNFSAEFVCRIARHIYFATEAFLDFSQGRR
jgi:hypothetical protein